MSLESKEYGVWSVMKDGSEGEREPMYKKKDVYEAVKQLKELGRNRKKWEAFIDTEEVVYVLRENDFNEVFGKQSLPESNDKVIE